MKGFVFGLILGSAVAAFAEVTAPHFAAKSDEDIQKCFATVQGDSPKTQVSFNLTEDGINYDSAVCWPEGIN